LTGKEISAYWRWRRRVVGMGLLFLAVGWWVFAVMERKARREGLGIY